MLCPSCLAQRHLWAKLKVYRRYATQSHYDVLALPRSASQKEIKSKFYELSKKHHPDISPDTAKLFTEINAAYGVLKDERSRRDYDRTLAAERGPVSSGSGLRSSGLRLNLTKTMGTPSSPYHASTNPSRSSGFGFGFGENPAGDNSDVRNQHFEYEQHRSRHSVFDERYSSRAYEEAEKRKSEAQDNFLARFIGITALVLVVIVLTGGISNVRAEGLEDQRQSSREESCKSIDWQETIYKHRRSLEHRLKPRD